MTRDSKGDAVSEEGVGMPGGGQRGMSGKVELGLSCRGQTTSRGKDRRGNPGQRCRKSTGCLWDNTSYRELRKMVCWGSVEERIKQVYRKDHEFNHWA